MINTFFALTFSFVLFQQMQLPAQWTPEFTIALAYSGSMNGDTTNIKFTHDQGTYKTITRAGKTIEYTFRMTESGRTEILSKLRALQVDKVRSEGELVVSDGWSRSICLGTSCLEGGPSANLSDEHRAIF